VAASDGDGDRNMILGKHFFITPSDSLAILAANAASGAGYNKGWPGIARSMPTSAAADRVAKALGIPCYETPTGWKFFGQPDGCGQGDAVRRRELRTGSDHLSAKKTACGRCCFWLNYPRGAQAIGWKPSPVNTAARFGRNFYSRHDYEDIPSDAGQRCDEVVGMTVSFRCGGRSSADLQVKLCDDFSYTDPAGWRCQ